MMAVLLTLNTFKDRPIEESLVLISDNAAVMAYQKLGGNSVLEFVQNDSADDRVVRHSWHLHLSKVHPKEI